VVVRPPSFYGDIPIFDVTGLRQTSEKCGLIMRAVLGLPNADNSDDRHGLLLRRRSHGPSNGGAAKRDHQFPSSNRGLHRPPSQPKRWRPIKYHPASMPSSRKEQGMLASSAEICGWPAPARHDRCSLTNRHSLGAS
jgi:hypothetical protein